MKKRQINLPLLSKSITTPKKRASDKYLININDFEVIRTIKRGGFGIINFVINKKTREEYATKTNLIQAGRQNNLFISREVHILIKIQHPTIVQFRGFSYTDFENRNNITIFMDYMKEGSLADLISQEIRSLCPLEYNNTKRQIILIGIARGMMILHSHHVIHRDLKPENILLDSNYYPHITDFGLSKFFDPHHSMNQSMIDAGTAQYMAPEVITSDCYNTKADVYAFGILMYEVVTGTRAYRNLLTGPNKKTTFQLKQMVCDGYRPQIEENSMKKGQKIMIEKCWSNNPKQRPTFDELFKKLSMSSIDYFNEFDDTTEEPKIFVDDVDDDNEEIVEGECEILGTTKFSFNNVDYEEIFDYVELISADSKSIDKNDNSKQSEIDLSKIESKILNLEAELADSKSKTLDLRNQVESMSKTIKDQSIVISNLKSELAEARKNQSTQISNLKSELAEARKNQSAQFSNLKSELAETRQNQTTHKLPINNLTHFFTAEMDLKLPGILYQLKQRENNPFDRQFIPSQSISGIYSLIDPNSNEYFGTSNDGDFFIEFELKEPVTANGIQIFSSFQDFPKSFDIFIEGKLVKSIKEAVELNGCYKNMIINFQSIRCQRIRIEQTGPNWDKGSNYLYIKRIELLSPEPKYSSGVFSTLVRESENCDPNKSQVHIKSTNFSFNDFHSLNPQSCICVSNKENSWFQVELTKSIAILNGFRLKKTLSEKLKSFKIICTDDVTKPISSWIKLIEINEKTEDEHKLLDIYEFPHPSPPVRFIRLVQTGKNWSNNYFLIFFHFDLFGSFSLEADIKDIKNIKSQIGQFFSAGLSLDEPGILYQLKKQEKSLFDRQFVASQSLRDIYCLINQNTEDDFCTNNNENFFIEFELEEPVTANGIQIFSSFAYFPKSFNIIIEGNLVKSIKDATELNGRYRSMTINFELTQCRRIRIEHSGPNWDKSTNFIHFKRIELLSPEPKYASGVFSTLVSESENHDPHKSRVQITSTRFDFNSFHLLDAVRNICTADKENSWFQVELTKTTAILNGFRLKRNSTSKLKSYKIICTDDVTKPISSWIKLIEINEKKEDEHKLLDIYEFPHPSPPVRFIRLVQTGKNWSDKFFLQFTHFELFGHLSLGKTIEKNIKDIVEIKSRIGRFFSIDLSLYNPGILCQLKQRAKNKFDLKFIASQSSGDIYSLLDPNTNDYFCTNNSGTFFIEFELEEQVFINGIQIFSSSSNFPKSFDLFIDGKLVESIKEANDLNGSYKCMTINFDSIQCQRIRFEQTGPNWDDNSNFIYIKRIELLSPENKYCNGIFSTLVNQSENHDPHKSRVIITSTRFDFNSFYLLDSMNFICSSYIENSWFQIELIKTTAILNGFRLKRDISDKMKNYKIICTDDVTKPISSWTTLIEINEKTEDEHKLLDIYEFSHPSPPVQFIRLVQTGKTWDNNLFLKFSHLDFFGSCF